LGRLSTPIIVAPGEVRKEKARLQLPNSSQAIALHISAKH